MSEILATENSEATTTPPEEMPQASSQETPPPQESPQENKDETTYTLDFGNFADHVSPDEAAFLSQLAKDAGVDVGQASQLIQSLALYNQASHDVQAKEWSDASQNDTEFGGDKLEANIAIANKALKTYGSESLIQMLSTSSLGNHPEVIRFLWKVGQTLVEDHMDGTRATVQGGFDARDFYPNSNMNP